MELESGARPNKNYASKLRKSIKLQVLEDHNFDTTENALFPKVPGGGRVLWTN